VAASDDPSIVGIASDVPPGPSAAGRQHLPLDGYDEIATFVTAKARLPGPAIDAASARA
jgi:hypothetical protein